MTAALLALYAGLAISFGAGGFRLERVQVDPWILARSPGTLDFPGFSAGGLTVPGVVWASTNRAQANVIEHELQHVRQMRALGPAGLALAYTVTGGRAFEDYRESMWEPPPGTQAQALFTWTPQAGVLLWGIPVGGANDATRSGAVADLHPR